MVATTSVDPTYIAAIVVPIVAAVFAGFEKVRRTVNGRLVKATAEIVELKKEIISLKREIKKLKDKE
jgi:cell division protein FtsB